LLKTSFFQKFQTPQKRGTQSSHTQCNKMTEHLKTVFL
jgi:hypothetical protein